MRTQDTIDMWRRMYAAGYPRCRKDPFTERILRKYLERYRSPPALLDLGCGGCPFLQLYQQFCGRIDLVDACNFAIGFEGLSRVSFHRANILSLPIDVAQPHDLVVASKLIHNIPRSMHSRVVGTIGNSLNRGGIAVISVASTADPAMTRSDLRLATPGQEREYVTGTAEGFPSYRYYFNQAEAEDLVRNVLCLQEVVTFSVKSGLPGHAERDYWMIVGTKQ